ncbi:MAG: hypothetical protein AAED33_09000 [Paracoccaceae bacterium]
MTQYIIVYRGMKNPPSPDQGEGGREKLGEWVANLGDAVVNAGTPCMHSKTVSGDAVQDTGMETAMTGYTIVETDSMDAAIEMAKSCPYLEMGDLEVCEQMSMG